MFKVQKQEGFTLVELAIVLVIVGLLIGGILKGQQMLQNSRVTATVAQINGFEAATTSFRDAYGELPGDLIGPDSRIAGCDHCTFGATTSLGDNRVGYIDWDFVTFQSLPLNAGTTDADLTDSSCDGTTAASCEATFAETTLFWYELQQSSLISAVTDEGITGAALADVSFDGTLPSAKIGGGFWIGNSSGTMVGQSDATHLGRPNAAGGGSDEIDILGTVLVTVAKATQEPMYAVSGASDGLQPFTPAVAANIDRKYDDGSPESGLVQAYGVTNSCYASSGGSLIYAEGKESKDCGLIIRIQR